MTQTADTRICTQHKDVLGKVEFRWVVVMLLTVFAAILSFMVSNFASVDRVEGNAQRILRLESFADRVDSKLDGIRDDVQSVLQNTRK